MQSTNAAEIELTSIKELNLIDAVNNSSSSTPLSLNQEPKEEKESDQPTNHHPHSDNNEQPSTSKLTEIMYRIMLGLIFIFVALAAEFLFDAAREIKGALSKTNVYVQPSLNEGLGIAAIEAMAMGCPCVFSNVGGLVELAKKGRNALLVPSKNSQKIVESVLWYYNNINESEKIAKNGKQYILNNFNSKLIADQYYRLYKQILK